jgi:DNA-binding NtrC family response regulator
MRSNNLKVLIVDDEADLLEILGMRFESKGYQVLSATNGIAAFEIVKSNKVDIIVSDINMPGGNGVDLLKKVKALDPAIPFILFVSGFGDITIEGALDMGAEAIFSKPFDSNVLLEATHKVIALSQEGRRLPQAARESTALNLEVQFGGRGPTLKSQVKNLGRGGFFMAMAVDLPKEATEVSFTIQIEGEIGISISGRGAVRWVRHPSSGGLPSGCGVEFLSFAEGGKTKLFEYINFLKTKQYIPKD